MFTVYRQAGQVALATAGEVIRLLRDYPFRGDADYFTVGRQEKEYLEILKTGDRFDVGHIAEGVDDSVLVYQSLNYEEAVRVATAFCDGDPHWATLLAAAGEPGRGSGNPEPDFPAAAPIEPQGFSCSPPLALLIFIFVMLLGLAAVYFFKP
ncbi:MAG: hypothetical protein GX444_15135 [Myxococcales bacterium]|nr:hypothetical protein [Myxococcales bacterium]